MREDQDKTFSELLAEAGERDGFKVECAVFEVVSKSTRAEDLMDKPETYASMGIPIYVIIDRKRETVRVLSEPQGIHYTTETTTSSGKPYTLDPVGLSIETIAYPAL